MKAETIFKDIADFRSYVDGMTADTTYEQLIPSVKTVTSDVMNIISADIYIEIREDESEDNEALEHLKTAIAAGAAYRYAIFASVKKNGSEAAMYKYQFEEVKTHYAEAHWKAMDTLLEWLDKSSESWQKTSLYEQRQAMPVKNAREFNEVYSIDNSSFFFQKIFPLMKSTWEYQVKRLIPAGRLEEAMDLAKHILVYRSLAKAVVQFDTAELPRSIRYDYSHEYAKDSSVQNREKLYNQLVGQAEAWEEQLKTMARTTDGSSIADDHNEESNKFYGMI